jgi:hypothetical protein
MAEETENALTLTSELAQSLGWLADAPLFIDGPQVEAFYDAVVQPEAEEGPTTRSVRISSREESQLGGKLEAEVSLPTLVKTVFPGIKVTGGLDTAMRGQEEESKEEAVELLPIKTPQRQLVHLAIHYVTHLRDRLFMIKVDREADPESLKWARGADRLPRALVFMDFPQRTILIPTAAELNSREVRIFYEEMVGQWARRGETLPIDYPDDPKIPEKELQEKRKKYWKWFIEKFQPQQAMRVVETVISSGGPIRWIDYRTPIAEDGSTLHLHLVGRGEYDTGAFAYNLVKRGFKHGFRLVGLLKSEPDVNVLAIFEK